MKASLFHYSINNTGEAAFWLAGREELLWVDIENGTLQKFGSTRFSMI